MLSSACGHSYSRGGIDGIFDNAKKSKRSARCPVAGCNVEISKENVKVSSIPPLRLVD